jgi:molybdopterin synthase catalytic subunit
MSKFDHGFSDEQWEAAIVESTAILIGVAKQKGRIAYSHFVEKLHTISLDAHDTRLNHLLAEVSKREDKEGRGMLSVIVVHKTGDMQPGPGFFELAKSLGRETSDILECWIREFNTVHDYWGN